MGIYYRAELDAVAAFSMEGITQAVDYNLGFIQGGGVLNSQPIYLREAFNEVNQIVYGLRTTAHPGIGVSLSILEA